MPLFLSSLKKQMEMAAEPMMGKNCCFAVFSRMQREDIRPRGTTAPAVVVGCLKLIAEKAKPKNTKGDSSN
jgi:hypothetical protein